MSDLRRQLPFGSLICAFLLGLTGLAQADVIAPPTVQRFAVWKDGNGDGLWQASDTTLTCVTNMLQWLSAGTSYGYKQYDNQKGADLSAWPNSSEAMLLDYANSTTGSVHKTWLAPSPNSLQFWMGWSRLDHDPNFYAPGSPNQSSNADFATAARGFNLNIIMNQEKKQVVEVSPGVWKTIHVPVDPAAPAWNNVKLGISVTGSQLTPTGAEPSGYYDLAPRVVLSDDFSEDPADFPSDPPYSKELPRVPVPSAGNPYPKLDPTQELAADGNVPAGYSWHFTGDWDYRQFSTDGGVIANLRPDPNNPESFIIAITLDRLYDPALGPDDPNGIKELVFYSFGEPGIYDPYGPATYDQAGYTMFRIDVSQLQAGDTIFITAIGPSTADCCDQVPEPLTLLLLASGGLGVAGVGLRKRFGRKSAR